MAEVPISYLPDVFPQSQDTMGPTLNTVTEISQSLNLRKLRRGWGPSSGLRKWGPYATTALSPADRQKVDSFLQARGGERDAFYFWTPDTLLRENFQCGIVTASSRYIIPLRVTGSTTATNPGNGVVGTLTDVRVAPDGIAEHATSKLFTVRHLLPRPSTYAALRFGGVTSYVSCGANSSLKIVGDVSISAWVYIANHGTQDAIVSNFTNGASGFCLRVQPDNNVYFFTGFASSFSQCNTTGAPFALGRWTLVTVVKSGSAVLFYVNGVLVPSTGAITNQAAATAAFEIGRDQGIFQIDGMVQGVRVYNAAISAGEVTNIFNESASASPNLVGWWRLTEGTGTVATDLSGNQNNGTLSGAALPVWVSGEEEVTFTGGAQTGLVTAWGLLRERVVVGYDGPSRKTSFVKSANLLALMAYSFVELY